MILRKIRANLITTNHTQIRCSTLKIIGKIMGKTIFKNSIFYWFLIGFLIINLIRNGYEVVSGNMFGVIPMIIQMVLLYLIFDKNKFAKIGIKIWSILLIVGPGLIISGGLIKVIAGENFNFKESLANLIMLAVGMLIFYFNNQTVEVQITENNEDK